MPTIVSANTNAASLPLPTGQRASSPAARISADLTIAEPFRQSGAYSRCWQLVWRTAFHATSVHVRWIRTAHHQFWALRSHCHDDERCRAKVGAAVSLLRRRWRRPIHALTGERRIEGSIAIIAESLSDTDYLAVTDTTACNDDRCVTASKVVAEADGVSPFCISPLPHEPRETGNTDAELKARFQQDAIPLREPLYRYALRLTTNHYDAEDLFQDTMVKAYSAFQSFRPGTNLNGWLHRILTNTYVSTYRKR